MRRGVRDVESPGAPRRPLPPPPRRPSGSGSAWPSPSPPPSSLSVRPFDGSRRLGPPPPRLGEGAAAGAAAGGPRDALPAGGASPRFGPCGAAAGTGPRERGRRSPTQHAKTAPKRYHAGPGEKRRDSQARASTCVQVERTAAPIVKRARTPPAACRVVSFRRRVGQGRLGRRVRWA